MPSSSPPIFHRNATIRWAATGVATAGVVSSIYWGFYRLYFVEGAWGLLLSSFALIVVWRDRLSRGYLVGRTTLALLGTIGLLMIHSLGFYLFPAVLIATMGFLPFTVWRVSAGRPMEASS